MATTVSDLIAQLQTLDPALPIGKIDGFRGFDGEIELREVKVDLQQLDHMSTSLNWRYTAHPVIFRAHIEDRMVDAIAID